MSAADTQFRYISAVDGHIMQSRTLQSTATRTTSGVSVRGRWDTPPSISGSGGSAAGHRTPGAAVRRSSSVTSAVRRRVGHVVHESRDAGAGMMTSLRWSGRWYSVEELAREYRRRFPLLALVTQADGCRCCSADANNHRFRLNVGQVLDIYLTTSLLQPASGIAAGRRSWEGCCST